VSGANVTLASNGSEALNVIFNPQRQKPFDLILMDFHMPVMDGLAATQKIRSRIKRGDKVPTNPKTLNPKP
jgi:CheY-like chemotaxis protein